MQLTRAAEHEPAGRRRHPRPAEYLTRAEVTALLAACGPGRLHAARDRALIVVMWRAGLRCAEALALRPADIDLGSGAVRVLRGKGYRPRTVYLDADGCEVVRAWLAARDAAGIQCPVLFCTLSGTRMDTDSGARLARLIIKGAGRRAGIAKDVHPHMLRHTFAYELDAEGVRTTVVQKALGHRSLATTAIYLNHLSAQDVAQAVRARPRWLESEEAGR